MTKHRKIRARIALTLAALVLAVSTWTPALADSGNPLDNVGVEHNVYLGCLMRNGGDPNVSPLQRIVEECGFDPGISTEEFVALYGSLVEGDPFLAVTERMNPYRSSYTDDQFSYFQRIDQVIADAQNASEADAMFAQLENEAIAQLTTNTAAERSIFAALSTARHSLQFWLQEAATTAENDQPEKPAKKLSWFKKVLVVVGVDLVCASFGTLIAGPAGVALGAGCSLAAATVKD